MRAGGGSQATAKSPVPGDWPGSIAYSPGGTLALAFHKTRGAGGNRRVPNRAATTPVASAVGSGDAYHRNSWSSGVGPVGSRARLRPAGSAMAGTGTML